MPVGIEARLLRIQAARGAEITEKTSLTRASPEFPSLTSASDPSIWRNRLVEGLRESLHVVASLARVGVSERLADRYSRHKRDFATVESTCVTGNPLRRGYKRPVVHCFGQDDRSELAVGLKNA